MPRLAFEEPKGGPLAKALQRSAQLKAAQRNAGDVAKQVEPDASRQSGDGPAEQLSDLFFTEEEDRQGRHRRKPDRDTVLVVLKAATVAAGLALVGLVILLTTSGEAEPAPKSPTVPQIPASDSSAPAPTTTVTDLGAIVVPPVHSHTTEMAPPTTTTTTTQPGTPSSTPGGGQDQFVRIGEPCDTEGAYAFTESREPVVCGVGRHGNRLAWRRLFR